LCLSEQRDRKKDSGGFMKSFVLLVCCALALTACGGNTTPNPTPDPQPTLPVSGTIEGVPSGTTLAGQTIEAKNASGDSLGSAVVNSDGTFSVTFKEPSASQLDLGKTEGLRSQVAATGYDCDSLDVNPGTVKGTVVTELTIGEAVIRGASDQAAATAWVDGSNSSATGTAYTFIYVDGNVTLKGTNCFKKSGFSLDFEAELVEGWNIVAIIKSSSDITAAVAPIADLSKVKWFYVAK
jgi:hypothetical protein